MIKNETRKRKTNNDKSKKQNAKIKKIASIIEYKQADDNESFVDDSLILRWCQMQCELCHETFQQFYDIKMHYQNVHNENGFVMCCKKKFFRRVRLMEHAVKHMNPDAFRFYYIDLNLN